MSLTVETTATYPDLRSAEQRAESKIRALNTKAARDLLRVARNTVHVRSGRLRDGLIVEGPFDVTSGELVATISAPSVPYADQEVARGGEHDFAARALENGQGIIDQAADDMEQAIISVMEGR